MMEKETFHNVKEAARFLGLATSTLNKRRITGGGPVYRKFGRKVVYAETDLLTWADSARRQSTSSAYCNKEAVTHVI